MKRVMIVATALSLLLPEAVMAQPDHRPDGGPPGPGGGGPREERQPPHPGPQPGGPGRPQPGRPGGPYPGGGPAPGRPMAMRPLPPRGNQFWHRGQYFPRVRGPAFAYPPGYGYRQWGVGAILPPALLGPTYFYPGYGALGLQGLPPGYQWVRYGPDLLLVNLGTGEVEDAVYGAFQ